MATALYRAKLAKAIDASKLGTAVEDPNQTVEASSFATDDCDSPACYVRDGKSDIRSECKWIKRPLTEASDEEQAEFPNWYRDAHGEEEPFWVKTHAQIWAAYIMALVTCIDDSFVLNHCKIGGTQENMTCIFDMVAWAFEQFEDGALKEEIGGQEAVLQMMHQDTVRAMAEVLTGTGDVKLDDFKLNMHLGDADGGVRNMSPHELLYIYLMRRFILLCDLNDSGRSNNNTYMFMELYVSELQRAREIRQLTESQTIPGASRPLTSEGDACILNIFGFQPKLSFQCRQPIDIDGTFRRCDYNPSTRLTDELYKTPPRTTAQQNMQSAFGKIYRELVQGHVPTRLEDDMTPIHPEHEVDVRDLRQELSPLATLRSTDPSRYAIHSSFSFKGGYIREDSDSDSDDDESSPASAPKKAAGAVPFGTVHTRTAAVWAVALWTLTTDDNDPSSEYQGGRLFHERMALFWKAFAHPEAWRRLVYQVLVPLQDLISKTLAVHATRATLQNLNDVQKSVFAVRGILQHCAMVCNFECSPAVLYNVGDYLDRALTRINASGTAGAHGKWSRTYQFVDGGHVVNPAVQRLMGIIPTTISKMSGLQPHMRTVKSFPSNKGTWKEVMMTPPMRNVLFRNLDADLLSRAECLFFRGPQAAMV